MFSLRDLVFPVNVDNTHWMTAHVVFTERTVYFYDSMKPADIAETLTQYASRADVSE